MKSRKMLITGKKFSKPEMSRVINGDIELKREVEVLKKMRMDQVLAQRYPEYYRGTLQRFIKAGYVKVGGEVVVKPNFLVKEEEEVELLVPEKKIAERPEVVYEDEEVVVLNKPAGMLSMKKNQDCLEPVLEDFGLLVHRLDRDTSGVVILAKNQEVQEFLRKQFQERKVGKKYVAVVMGALKLKEAKIDLPIARNLRRPTTFQVDPQGKEAQTEYRVLAEEGGLSLVELAPKTGRTHQLRVHLNYLSAPILGDKVYLKRQKIKVERLYLHARELEIELPDGERRKFVVEEPTEFWKYFKGGKNVF